MNLKYVELMLSREELQIITNCVVTSLNQDDEDYSYKEKFDMYLKLCEKLDRFTEQDMKMANIA